MEEISKYIATVSFKKIDNNINNAEIIINNLKLLINFTDNSSDEIHITKNNIYEIKYNDLDYELEIVYNNDKDLKNLYIKFDKQSESAYKLFSENIKEFNKIKGCLYYLSGNHKMEGEFTLDENTGRYSANGNALVYYDTPDKSKYYEGEIDNEKFDGSGIFYNKIGNIILKVNNIDQNNPIGNGKLTLKTSNGLIYYEKIFNFDLVEEIDFSNFDLDFFVEDNLRTIFDDINNYDKYKDDFNIDIKIKDLMSKDNPNEIIYRKLFELELKMENIFELLNKIDSKLPEKRTGFWN